MEHFNQTQIMDQLSAAIGAPAVAWLIAISIFLAIIILVGVYIYFAFAWKRIAENLKFKKSWIAWIPFANLSMILHLGRFHWAWIFIILIPIAGWIALAILLIISHWKIFEDLNYYGFYSLGILFPGGVGFGLYMVAIGFVAWKKLPTVRRKK